MKSIILSIQPKYVAKILSGEKTIEVRKVIPQCETPFKVYIYCTKEKFKKECALEYDDIQPIKELILSEIETLKAEIAELKEQLKDTIKLPCKVGDTVYVVPSETNFCLNAMFGHKEDNRIYEQIIESINFYKAGVYTAVTCDGLYTNHSEFFNENWFLTKELAENRLKELKEGK